MTWLFRLPHSVVGQLLLERTLTCERLVAHGVSLPGLPIVEDLVVAIAAIRFAEEGVELS